MADIQPPDVTIEGDLADDDLLAALDAADEAAGLPTKTYEERLKEAELAVNTEHADALRDISVFLPAGSPGKLLKLLAVMSDFQNAHRDPKGLLAKYDLKHGERESTTFLGKCPCPSARAHCTTAHDATRVLDYATIRVSRSEQTSIKPVTGTGAQTPEKQYMSRQTLGKLRSQLLDLVSAPRQWS